MFSHHASREARVQPSSLLGLGAEFKQGAVRVRATAPFFERIKKDLRLMRVFGLDDFSRQSGG